jgi:hypothetical protein
VLSTTDYPFFLYSIFAVMVPPFSRFFCVVLEHYQVHALHLHPNSIAILSVFAFTCEAFLSIEPSIAFFRNYYSL